MKIIAFTNQKGGVGKTTTAACLGAALTDRGKKVFLIDMDPQGNLTVSFGLKAHELNATVYEVLKEQATISEAAVDIERPGGNLKLLPANLTLSAAETELSSKPGREFLLKEALHSYNEAFDYILIDCPPSLGLLTINALVAAGGYIIPLASEFLALYGTSQLLEVVEVVRKRINPELALTGVVITQFDSRKLHSREIVEQIKEFFGDRVFDTVIRSNVSLTEAPSFGQDILTYKPNSPGAEDYSSLADELLKEA